MSVSTREQARALLDTAVDWIAAHPVATALIGFFGAFALAGAIEPHL